jgi:benzoyl-CoA reductase/2-hydroxyglutaryl-CoA dehydratase subunit BcrC/BadD/HgdB
MFNWNKHINQILHWVREYEIDGVLNFPAIYAYWRELFSPYLHERLDNEKIPIMTFLRQYHVANVGQLKTRIQAFLEILESRIGR